VRSFLKQLRNPKYGSVQQAFYVILLDSISQREMYVSTPASSKTHLELLKWITIVGRGAESLSPEFATLFALLTSRVQGKRLEQSAEQKVRAFIASIKEEVVVTQLVKNLMNTAGSLVAISLVVRCVQKRKQIDEFVGVGGFPSKGELLELFGKDCLMTKVPKSSWMLEKCTENILGLIVDEALFKETLLPVIKKAMLRSPEIAIEVYTLFKDTLCIDFRYNFTICLSFALFYGYRRSVLVSELCASI
jgi:hypothetical protein